MEEDSAEIELLFKNKKKKKVKKEEAPQEVKEEDGEDMTYDEMLSRLFSQMEPVEGVKKLRIQPPKLAMIGSKRTGWSNFLTIVEALDRDPIHMSSFLEAELGTTVSHAKEGVIVIKGRFRTNQIESLLKKYVEKFVKCKTCLSSHTSLTRNQITRLTFLQCKDCRSEWTVETITKYLAPALKKE
jgi:translation initiation factor 2 subunit 2